MGKVSRQMAGLNLSGAPAAARHNVQVKHSKPDYKVQVEQITQKKKKLLSMTTYRVQAPPGYTFIPLASHELTDKCKDLSRQDGVQVHVVSTSKGGKNSTELSRQVGRVGHHFPSSVVARALNELGYDIDRSGRILNDLQRMSKGVGNEASRKDQKGTRIGEGVTDRAELKKIQDRLNDEARASLTTLFPRMPNRDKKDVVKHAFAIGKDRIGSSAELSIDRRVHLAVLAHIRHTYTDYDKLLKEVPYQTARSIVEQKTLQKIIEWRGEGDNDDDVEEILREVIVIDDGDDDDEPISPNQVDVSGDDNEEIQFRTSPIAADKIDSRPYVTVRSPGSGTYLVPASDNPYHGSTEQGRYVRVIDPERRRRHDDRVRHIWQEAKRTYREAIPVPSTAYVPISSEHAAEVSYARPEAYTTQRHYQEEPYWDRPQERVVNVASKPQMVMLSQPKVGVSRDIASTYDMEPVRRGPQTSQRRTSEYREVVHQSIERPVNEPKSSVYREVIVLDSPPAENPRPVNPSQALIYSGDRRNTVGTLELVHSQHTVAPTIYANGGYSVRKRTFDELDPVAPTAGQAGYANKIVHLSSGADARLALAYDKNTYTAQPTSHVAPVQSRHSPRRYDARLMQDAASRRVSNSMHFYQNTRASPPRHIFQTDPDSRAHGEQVSYVRTYPREQEVYAGGGHHMSRVSSAYDHNFSTRQDIARGQHYPVYEHDQRRNTIPSASAYEPHHSSSYQYGRSDILPAAGMLPSNGGSGSHQQYRAERPGDEGMRRHLQRLHFYEPPRAATTTAPKRFYDEQGREVIVVEKR